MSKEKKTIWVGHIFSKNDIKISDYCSNIKKYMLDEYGNLLYFSGLEETDFIDVMCKGQKIGRIFKAEII